MTEALPPDFTIKRHDRLPLLRAQLMTDTEVPVPVDLTNATSVKFIMTTAVGAATKVSAAGFIENALLGIVRYEWAAVDTNTPGNYLGEWEVTWANAKKQTFPTGSYHTIAVLADLDGA